MGVGVGVGVGWLGVGGGGGMGVDVGWAGLVVWGKGLASDPAGCGSVGVRARMRMRPRIRARVSARVRARVRARAVRCSRLSKRLGACHLTDSA